MRFSQAWSLAQKLGGCPWKNGIRYKSHQYQPGAMEFHNKAMAFNHKHSEANTDIHLDDVEAHHGDKGVPP